MKTLLDGKWWMKDYNILKAGAAVVAVTGILALWVWLEDVLIKRPRRKALEEEGRDEKRLVRRHARAWSPEVAESTSRAKY